MSSPDYPLVVQRSLWSRVLLMVLMAFAFQIAITVLGAVALLQLIFAVFAGGANARLRGFGRSASTATSASSTSVRHGISRGYCSSASTTSDAASCCCVCACCGTYGGSASRKDTGSDCRRAGEASRARSAQDAFGPQGW